MSDFKTVNVRDERLNPVSEFEYPVMTGAANITPQGFVAQTASQSGAQINVVVPSFETCIDRRVRIKSKFTIQNTYTLNPLPADAAQIMYLGQTESLCSYPFNSQLQNIQCNLNNQSLQLQSADILPFLKQMYNSHEIQLLNSGCPNQRDTYADYTTGQYALNNACGAYGNTDLSSYYQGNGSWPLKITVQYLTTVGGAINPANPILITNPNITLAALRVHCGLAGAGAALNDKVIFNIEYTTEEPLIGLSPFTYIDSDQPALYGVNNLNFIFNFQASNRMWRSGNPLLTSSTIQTVNNNDVELRVIFLSPKDSMLMPKKSISPYYEVIPYKSAVGKGIVNEVLTVTASSIQLNCIFDTLLIGVQRVVGKRTPATPDAFLSVANMTMTFNNSAGILSTANTHDLYEMSRKYGGIGQSYAEFRGTAFGSGVSTTANLALSKTVGSVIALRPLLSMGLDQSYLSSGSIGAYNLLVTVTLQPLNDAIAAGDYELVIIPVNSGIISIEAGTCSKYIAVLNKQDVMKASEEPVHMTNEGVRKLIGGGWLDNIGSHLSTAFNVAKALAPAAKMALNMSGNDNAAKVAQMMGNVGLGVGAGVGYGVGAGRDQRLR